MCKELKDNSFSKLVESINESELSHPVGRYMSYDYCYNYFRRNINKFDDDLEKSCLVLGFYLASWGMYRGSSFILQKSIAHYKDLIKYLNTLGETYWEIDLDNYNKDNIDKLIELYNKISELLRSGDKIPSITLVTKIMLGVFGSVPAFDTNFKAGISPHFGKKTGFNNFNETALLKLTQVYNEYSVVINNLSKEYQTIDFETYKKTGFHYTKAKILDMYGFMKGMKIIDDENERKKAQLKNNLM